jgi:hypothetical protein
MLALPLPFTPIVLSLLAALVTTSCGDGGYPPLAKERGDEQVVAQHTQLPAPAVVLVRDPTGRPLAGVAVSISAPADGPYLRPETVLTDVEGHAAWNGYLHSEGPQVLMASIAGSTEPVAFHFEVSRAGQPFDGVYSFDPAWTPLQCRQHFQVVGSEVTHLDGTLPCYFRSASFSPTSGEFLLLIRLSLNREHEFTGRLSLDARGLARGTLTVQEVLSTPPPAPPPVVVGVANFERL